MSSEAVLTGFLRSIVSFAGVGVSLGLFYYGYKIMKTFKGGLLARAAKVMVVGQSFFMSGFILVELEYGLGVPMYPFTPGLRRWAMIFPFLMGAFAYLYVHYRFGEYFGVLNLGNNGEKGG